MPPFDASGPDPPHDPYARPPSTRSWAPEAGETPPTFTTPSTTTSSSARPRSSRGESGQIYGYDHGLPDLDIPHNQDITAILPRGSPTLRRASAESSGTSTPSSDTDTPLAFEPGGYYASPVPIRLPLSLSPLPSELTSNPMNLLYFHHFLSHTARVLVPHDCPSNPFRTVLPIMAIRNPQLLHLLLSYSASHRARLLEHSEPRVRIAGWMDDVIPALRNALSPDHNLPTGDLLAPLATAIMLASLSIISPATSSIQRIPWQSHLAIARALIVRLGGLQHLAYITPTPHAPLPLSLRREPSDGSTRDTAVFFLSRWFAYLDVLGSLSGSSAPPLPGAYLEDGGGAWLVNRGDEEVWRIDCFFGFSGRCISLLASVAELASEAETTGGRLDPATRTRRPSWTPNDSIRNRADALGRRLEASAGMGVRGCLHGGGDDNTQTTSWGSAYRDMSTEMGDDSPVLTEILATNRAYHYAAQIHLSRRVLNLPSESEAIQRNVRRIVKCLEQVRRGSSAESCLLFPIFTGGCEALGAQAASPVSVRSGSERLMTTARDVFRERLVGVEGWGMEHMGRARAVMEKVWESGGSVVGWEGLVEGEFFG